MQTCFVLIWLMIQVVTVVGWFKMLIHYFLECRLYTEARTRLISNLDFLENLEIETLLFGNSASTEEQNLKIFKGIQEYIQQTNIDLHSCVIDLGAHLCISLVLR